MLEVASDGKRATIAIAGGVVRALAIAPTDDDAIGDLLHRAGDFDAASHRRALEHGAPDGPVGRWLVDARVTSAAGLSLGLRRQLKRRMSRVLGWSRVELSFHAIEPSAFALVDEPVAVGDLVLAAARERARETDAAPPRGEIELGGIGRHLVEHAALAPREAVIVRVLRDGPRTAEDCVAIAGGDREARRALAVLVLAHAVGARRGGDARVLFEKRMQIERSAPPETLLGLRAGSTREDARRALRRLARVLHPDRFHGDEAMRRASEQVLAALVAAERDLRERRASR